MRVVVNTVEEFCSELRDTGQKVLGKVVRMRIDADPEQDEGLTFLISVWLTAVVAEDNGGVYLLEFGGIAGSDDAQGDNGTEQAKRWESDVHAAAAELGLRVRPGKIEVA